MGEIVNLRRARKAKARLSEETKAEQTRIRFGTAPRVRKAAKAEKLRAERAIEAHMIGCATESPPED